MHFRRTRRIGRKGRRIGRRRGSFRRSFRRFSKRGLKGRGHASRMRVRQPTFFSDATFVKLNYHTRLYIQAGATPKVYIYELNDIWDPDGQVGGKTAYGQEYWAALYQKFTVYGSKIYAELIGTNAVNASQCCDLVYWPTASSTIGSDNDFNSVIPYAKQKIIQLGSGRTNYRVKSYMSTAKICGVDKKRISDDPNFSGLTSVSSTGGASPNNLAAWFFSFQSADRVATIDCILNLKITYYVKFYGRKIPLWNIASSGDTDFPSHAFNNGPTGGYTGPYGPSGAAGPNPGYGG